MHDSAPTEFPRVAGANGLATDQMFTQLYRELHQIAARKLRRSGAVAWSPTTLLHETFLKMSSHEPSVNDQAHFVACAARAMRHLIVDQRRHRKAYKRGGGVEIVSLPTELPHADIPDDEVERLSDAIETLAAVDARLAECVELKFFCGFSLADIGALLQVSERTVQRDWDKARVLLNRFLMGRRQGIGGVKDQCLP